MHHAMDATLEDKGPITNNNTVMAIYYIVFVVIFTFMIINIYIALIILTFQRQGEKEIEGGLDRNQVYLIQLVIYITDWRNLFSFVLLFSFQKCV